MKAAILLSNVRQYEREMCIALAGLPHHSLIDDLMKSYSRLASQLEGVI